MSKNKSEIKVMASGAGLLTSVWSTLTAAVESRGGSAEDLHVLSTPKGKEMLEELADKLVAGSESRAKLAEEERKLQELIQGLKLDWVFNEITAEHFPSADDPATELSKLEVVHLNKELTTDQVKAELEKRGYQLEGLRSLLIYGKANPEEQRRYPIVALRSGWVNPYGNRNSPCLDGAGAKRGLDLSWNGPQDPWDRHYRFLVSRK